MKSDNFIDVIMTYFITAFPVLTCFFLAIGRYAPEEVAFYIGFEGIFFAFGVALKCILLGGIARFPLRIGISILIFSFLQNLIDAMTLSYLFFSANTASFPEEKHFSFGIAITAMFTLLLINFSFSVLLAVSVEKMRRSRVAVRTTFPGYLQKAFEIPSSSENLLVV